MGKQARCALIGIVIGLLAALTGCASGPLKDMQPRAPRLFVEAGFSEVSGATIIVDSTLVDYFTHLDGELIGDDPSEIHVVAGHRCFAKRTFVGSSRYSTGPFCIDAQPGEEYHVFTWSQNMSGADLRTAIVTKDERLVLGECPDASGDGRFAFRCR